MCLREVEQLQQEKQKLDDELRAAEMGMNLYPQQRLVDDDNHSPQAPYKVNGINAIEIDVKKRIMTKP